MDPEAPPESPPPPPPAKPRRRLRKILIWTGASLGVLALTVLVAGPTVIAAVIRSKIASAVAENLDATSEIASVSFSWSGKVALRDLVVRDRAGGTVASVKSVDVDVALFSALRGRIIADVRVDAPRLDIRRLPDGKLNVETLSKPAPATAPPAASKPAPEKKSEPPDMQVKLAVTGGVVSIEGTELTDLKVNVTMDSPHKPTEFVASVTTPGSGRVRASGELSFAKTGGLKIDIENLPLAPFAPIAKLKSLEGLVNGALEYRLVSADRVTGGGEIRISGIAVDAAKLPDVTILQAFGEKPTIAIHAGEALDVQARGNLPFEGTFNASAKLGPLSELAAAFFPFKTGSKIEGAASARGSFSMASALSVQLTEATAKIRGAELKASGSLEGATMTFKAEAEVSPDELRPILDLPVTGPRITFRAEGTDRSARGLVTAPLLKIRDVEQKNLKAEFDVALGADRLDVRSLSLRSDTASATAKGYATMKDADLTFDAEGEVAAIAAIAGVDARGALKARGSLKGNAGKLAIEVDADVAKFEYSTFKEPKVGLKIRAGVTTEKMDVEIQACDIDADFARGSMSGKLLSLSTAPEFRPLAGKLTWIPSRVGALLKSVLPGELKGDKPEKVEFTLEGRAATLDPLEVLRGVKGSAALGLGTFTMTGLAATGALDVKLGGGKLTAGGKLAINEGNASLQIEADLRAPQGKEPRTSKIELSLEHIRANAGMGPLLQLIHPVFSVAGDAAGKLDGRVEAALSIRYDGPLTADLLASGWEKFPKAGLNGGGKFEIHDCQINGSALLGEVFGSLAAEKRDVKMHPIQFRIVTGRVIYDNPWQWTISGSDTTFTGSIGLDRTLDMVWHIPVTDELASRVPALKYSKGKTLDAPLGGTVEKPRLGWKEVVGKVAGDRAEEAAKKGLEDLLGGKDEKKAKKLLEEADALRAQGKPAEAAEKYRKIKDDYRRTRVYKDNKERIDTGAEGR